MTNKIYVNNLTTNFCVSIIYGFIIYSGFIGFGIDYVAAYNKPNFVPSHVFNFFGWSISTLNLFGIQIGSFLTPFLISFSSGLLLNYFFRAQDINSNIFFILILVISILSWPLVISSNNAMRQGIMMSFIFFGLFYYSKKYFFISILFFLLAVFTHRSGVAYFTVFVFTIISYYIKFIISKNDRNFFFISGVIFFLGTLVSMSFIPSYYGTYDTNTPIGIDFVFLNVVINILFIFFTLINSQIYKNFYYLFLFFFSFSSLAIYYSGNYWELERYNMVMMIPYIYSFSIFVKNNFKYFYFLFVMLILLLMTIQTGMYDLGVGIFLRN